MKQFPSVLLLLAASFAFTSILLSLPMTPGPPSPVRHRRRPSATVLPKPLSSPELRAWEARVGGLPDRKSPWLLEKGCLRLPRVDPLLRVLHLRKAVPKDLRLELRIRVEEEGCKGRAGLVFRSGMQGYYVFRICPDTRCVQLMWHGHSPFSWWELATAPAPQLAMPSRSHHLAVELRGSQLSCRLDGRRVIDVLDERGRQGGVGIYGCDGAFAFDAFASTPLSPGVVPPWMPVAPRHPNRFWLHASFDHALSSRDGWTFMPEGAWTVENASLLHSSPPGPSVALLGPAIRDATVNVRLRIPDEGEGGLVFRWRKEDAYLCVLDRKQGRLEVRRRQGRLQQLLARGKIRETLDDRWYRLQVETVGTKLVVALSGKPVLRLDDCVATEGRTGVFAARGRLRFDDFLLATHPEGGR